MPSNSSASDLHSGGTLRRWISGRQILWIAFTIACIIIYTRNLAYPDGMNDVRIVYYNWAQENAAGNFPFGTSQPWVYPILALWPMAFCLWLGPEYFSTTWIIMVMALNAAAFGLLLGGRSRLTRSRRNAARWWLGYMVLLGPIGVTRIDSVTVPLVIVGLLLVFRYPVFASVLLSIATWMKVWPAGVIVAAITAMKSRRRIFIGAASLSAVIIIVSLARNAGLNIFGFLALQGSRALQVESPFAVFWLWQRNTGNKSIDIAYNYDILTLELRAPGTETAAALATPLTIFVIAALLLLSTWITRRGVSGVRLLAPLSLAIVTALILFNKVGSPQFFSWLAPPLIFALVFNFRKFRLPALLGLIIAFTTQLIYPVFYIEFINTQTPMLWVFTIRLLALIAIFACCIVELIRLAKNASRTQLTVPNHGPDLASPN